MEKRSNAFFITYKLHPMEDIPEGNSAQLRETQLKTMDLLDRVGMAVTLDIGENQSIHPAEKIKVGERLSYWALAKDYNIQGIQFSGPVYKSHKIYADKIMISFDYASMGLSTYGQPLNNLKLQGQMVFITRQKLKF